ncbi:Protein involved in Snf1 protein kinase complex assembly [Phaffia rhodozyma]|uniref:Protein involved in Snf1 protein kinase complex assembly n=1 Tax=Phaffia rhodozyma TaxID=264483 RepID=A0A0F7SNU6_PHARH|nr:Protein involved in Snf1 protein kinase complex assembly [Phaffia rhodozyma]
MASSTYSAKFFWPDVHPHSVIVTGSFDNWSGNTHHLQKHETGFEAVVELEYNKAYEFKYVVDGNWQAREDQDKEWDSQGNMNNVYRTPEAPATTEEPVHSPIVASNAVDSSAIDQSNRELGTNHQTIPSQKPASITSAKSVKDAELTNSAPLHANEQVIPETTVTSLSTETEVTPAQDIKKSTLSDEISDITKSTSTVGTTSSPVAPPAPFDRSDKDTVIVPTPAQAFAHSASNTPYDPNAVTGIGAHSATGSSAVQETTPKLEQRELSPSEHTSYPPGLGAIMGGAKGTNSIADKNFESETRTVEYIDDHKLAGVSGFSEADTDYSMLDDNLSSTASEQNFEHIASPRIEEEPLVVVPHPVKTASSANIVPSSTGDQTTTRASFEDPAHQSSASAAELDIPPQDEDDLPSHAKAAAEAINSANAAHPSAEDPTNVPTNISERNTDEILIPAGSGDPKAMEPSTTVLEKQGKDAEDQDDKRKQGIGANSSNADWSKAPTTSSATTTIDTNSSSHQHDQKRSTNELDSNKASASTKIPATAVAAPSAVPIPVVVASGPSPTLKSTGLPTSASGTLSIPETQNIHAISQPAGTTSELSTSSSHLKSPKPMNRSVSAASSIRDVPGQYPNVGSGFTTQSSESTPASSPAKPQRTASERDEAVKKRKSGLFGRIGKLFGSK